MNAVVMDGAVVGQDSFVAAMAFVKAGFEVPPRTLVAGMPARIVRELTDAEIAWKRSGTREYQELARRSRTELVPCEPLREIEPDRKRVEPLTAILPGSYRVSGWSAPGVTIGAMGG